MPKIFRLSDSICGRDLINQRGEEPDRPIAKYKDLVFGLVTGSVRLHNHFYVFNELGEVELDWKYLHGMLNGRPVGITMKKLKTEIMKLINAKVPTIYIYTKSMALGLHSWSYCNPEGGKTMRKAFGEDEWVFSPTPIGTSFEGKGMSAKEFDKPNYEEVNAYLKTINAEFRVKFGKGFSKTRVFRSDLW